jgi:hypothetical protein
MTTINEPATSLNGPVVEVVQVTPRMAEQWLARNGRNRRLREATIKSYARQMAAGRWTFNGEAIQIDNAGNLLNGQHRLTALVEAEITLPLVVVSNLPPEAQDVLDTQARRTAGDMLTLHNEQDTNVLAGAIRRALLVERTGGYARASHDTQVGHAEIKDWLAAHPDIRVAASLARRHARGMDAPSPAVLAYAVWRLRQIDPDEAELFLIDADTKANLSADDPALALGSRLAELRRQGRAVPVEEQLSLIFRAWNARRSGRGLTILRSRGNNGQLVSVPEPI